MDLEGQTPLEKSQVPGIDQVYSGGRLFTLDGRGPLVEENFLSLFEVESGNFSEAPLQAIGKGKGLISGQVALSVRLVASVDGIVLDTGNEIVSDFEGASFCESLNARLEEKGFHFFHVEGPEAVLICSEQHLKTLPSQENPILWEGRFWKDSLSCFCEEVMEALKKGGELLLEHEVNQIKFEFEQNPITGFLICGGGRSPETKKMDEKGVLYTQNLSMLGVGRLLGMDIWKFPSEHRRFSHLELILRGIEEKIEQFQTLVIDLPYIWQSTYKGDLLEKIKTIEFIDKNFVCPLIEKFKTRQDVQGILSPFGNVDVTEGKRCSGTFPVLVWDEEEWTQAVEIKKFSEGAVGESHLSLQDFLPFLFEKELALT